MLKTFEKVLSGTLLPVLSRTGRVDKGVSQSIVEGSQLPISTIERTIIDSVTYTKEIGGAGEALIWTRATFPANRLITQSSNKSQPEPTQV